jgi:hypothetical protein
MITLDSYPTPNPTVAGSIVEGEAVLVLPEQGQVKVLNEVGARVWSLADGTRTVRDIVAVICAEYDVEPTRAEADTLGFLAELVDRQILSFLLLLTLLLDLSATPARAAVTLVSFTAMAGDGQVLLRWETATEYENAGFFIRRSMEEAGDYTRISDFIPARGNGPVGAVYSHADQEVEGGITYFYMLEAIDNDQSVEFHGPVSITLGAVDTVTPTPTLTPSATSTASPSATLTPGSTATSTPTGTLTLTHTPGPISTLTSTTTASPAAAALSTHAPTATETPTHTVTLTASPTPTPTETPNPTATPTQTVAPSPTATAQPTSTLTPMPTHSPTPTPTFTLTTTPAPSQSPEPTQNPTPTATPLPTSTLTVSISPTTPPVMPTTPTREARTLLTSTPSPVSADPASIIDSGPGPGIPTIGNGVAGLSAGGSRTAPSSGEMPSAIGGPARMEVAEPDTSGGFLAGPPGRAHWLVGGALAVVSLLIAGWLYTVVRQENA